MLPFLIFSLLLTQISAARILAIVPTPAYSHQVAVRPIWNTLSLRGHQVTLLTTDVMDNPNITQINLHDSYKFKEDAIQIVQNQSVLEMFFIINEVMDNSLDFQMSQPAVQALIKNESLFDIVIAETLVPEFLAFADLYKCPSVLMSSLPVANFLHRYFGNSANPVSNPDLMLPFVGSSLDFKARFVTFIYDQFYSYFKWFKSFPTRHQILKKHFGANVKSPHELYGLADMLLLNVNPVIHDIREYGPNTLTIGGGNHILPPKPLPKDLQDYLDSATEGCIYFSLGTNSKSMHLGKEKIDVIMETLSELPYKVLWKFEIEDMIKPPKNIKFISWAPQQDILRHPNIKLFITQGGLQSLEESIISHVPMVMLPIYADQESNAKRMEYRGLARVVPHKPMPVKEEFKSIIMDVINDPKYKERVIKTAELLLDQPMTGVEKAVWWIEYVIRHKGAKHLKNPAVDIPTYQYYCLDVIGAILSFFYIVFKIISWILRGLKKLIWRKPKVARRVAQKKKKQ